jgi:NAD(P)-dependent dehydrogenase (short-subunit alcohol dehydrogenase family)
MATTLAGQTVVVVGGSSGMGYAVAKASLLAQAAHVIVVSTSEEKAARTVERLRTDVAAALAAAPAGTALPANGTVTGDTVNSHDLASVRALCDRVGEVDHLVWTAGDPAAFGFPQKLSLDENKGAIPSTCIRHPKTKHPARLLQRALLGPCAGRPKHQDQARRVHHLHARCVLPSLVAHPH